MQLEPTTPDSRFSGGPLRPEDIHSAQMPADPAVSPDGKLVAVTVLTQDRDANQQRGAIWVVPADGSAPPRQLTRGPRRDLRARFSPDGKRLAFLPNREYEWRNDLYVLDLSRSEPTRVARLPRGTLEFDWCPARQRQRRSCDEWRDW
jgi:Tol biopolymer transport system component